MAVLNIWLPLIGGGVFTAIAIGAWFAEHRLTGIWFGLAATVSFALLAALQLHEHEVARMHPVPPVKQADSPDRAWIAVQIELAGPLAYDGDGWGAGVRWHIPIKYRLANTGNTPAGTVDFHADIRPFMVGWLEDQMKNGVPPQGTPPGLDTEAELKKFCAGLVSMNQHLGSFMGHTLFKGQAIERHFHLNGNPALFDGAKNDPRRYSGNILLLVCAPTKPRPMTGCIKRESRS